MYGVVRFLDSDLLPASSPEDYPKIIKSGIDEYHQHHMSPNITGPSGITTLLHNIGRQQLLEHLLDTTGTEEFDLRIFMDADCYLDLYVKRRGLDVEFGFFNCDAECQWAQPGVRYRIVPEPAGSLYCIGKWIPVSSSNHGSDWSGSDIFVRGVGTMIAKGIWFHENFRQPNVKVSWSGMTRADKDDLAAWLKERAERLALYTRKENEEYQELEAMLGNRQDKLSPDDYACHRLRMACRADCGEKYPMRCCSKCKVARYCSPYCQKEDWKYHKTYCGNEFPIPKEFKRAFREAQRRQRQKGTECSGCYIDPQPGSMNS